MLSYPMHDAVTTGPTLAPVTQPPYPNPLAISSNVKHLTDSAVTFLLFNSVLFLASMLYFACKRIYLCRHQNPDFMITKASRIWENGWEHILSSTEVTIQKAQYYITEMVNISNKRMVPTCSRPPPTCL